MFSVIWSLFFAVVNGIACVVLVAQGNRDVAWWAGTAAAWAFAFALQSDIIRHMSKGA